MSIIEYRGFDDVFKYSGPWLWWLVGFYLCLPVIAYKILPFITSKGTYSGKRKTISIFVLGDLGHSPRMCYHARSFSKLEYFVNLCGYLETQPSYDIIDDVNIELHPITPVKNTFLLPYLVFALQKVFIQLQQLFNLLLQFRGSDYILIQNPPSVPILALVIVFIKVFSRNTELIIDWHNLNYSILNLRYNNLKHPLVRAVQLYERFLGRFAELNLTVTNQMKSFLVDDFHLQKRKIITLHDRPADRFQPLQELEFTKEEVFRNHGIFADIENIQDYKILVSATSFTPDEDFNLLLGALKKYELSESSLPPILLIVTGKGPMKLAFLERVDSLKFSSKVIVRTAWLASEDYPVILSMADLGISLHTSSSGIDLPMKIVDFFGCGVPVISLNFPAIGELVKNNYNGLITASNKDSSVKQTDEIYRLITRAFTEPALLATLKEGAMAESKLRWDENWSSVLNSHFA